MNIFNFLLLLIALLFTSISTACAQSNESSIERQQVVPAEKSLSEVSAAKQALKAQVEKPELQAATKKSEIPDVDRTAVLDKIKYLQDLNCCEDEIAALTKLLNSPRN